MTPQASSRLTWPNHGYPTVDPLNQKCDDEVCGQESPTTVIQPWTH